MGRILDYPNLHAFTWDEDARLWILSASANRLQISRMPAHQPGVIEPVRSIQRNGNERSSLLVHANTAFVADGGAIRVIRTGAREPEDSVHVLPPHLFPAHSQATALHWSPLGHIYFVYRSVFAGESGVGRVSPDGAQWDVVAKGISGNIAFDADGFAIACDPETGSLFRLAPGLDYQRGLENYNKSDLALRTDRAGLRPLFATVDAGSAWADGSGSWLVLDGATATLDQFRAEDGLLKEGRPLARLEAGARLADLQIGPDGDAWLLIGDPGDPSGTNQSSIFRLEKREPSPPSVPRLTPGGAAWGHAAYNQQSARPRPLRELTSPELIAEFGSPNAWRRDAALRLLVEREDLRAARGLHPKTPLHDSFRNKSNSPAARVYAALALHRLGLLDETFLEYSAEDPQPLVRAWTALLFGERNYPTGPAFEGLLKLAKDTNLVVRSAAAVAARQFVSGSLAADTPPRGMPIREVFTGGILSTLWFSTEKGSTPEFDLLFWNAVRPITAFDSAHPIGFFHGDNESALELAYWILPRITRQIAQAASPLQQEDAMLMVAGMNPSNVRMLTAALQGLKDGTPARQVLPTEPSLEVLRKFTRSENPVIASLGQDILAAWARPFLR